jgi:hypothetical protein
VFERLDPARAPREVIVSRALAERYWRGGESAVGKRVRMTPDGAWYTIVGVAGDVRGTALEEPPDETIYLPLVTIPGAGERESASDVRWTPREIALVARSAGDPALIASRVTSVVRELDAGVPVYGARAMTEVVVQASARTSFMLLLLGIASTVALALGAVGIYGVISYVVSLRTREIAVRLALGAQPADVRRMVSRQAIAVAAIGIGVGIVGAVGTTRALGALLFGVSPTDAVTLVSAAVLLLGVAVVASWLPAQRAAGVDPAQALRAE